MMIMEPVIHGKSEVYVCGVRGEGLGGREKQFVGKKIEREEKRRMKGREEKEVCHYVEMSYTSLPLHK